jgi:Ser-tRNA(Ala) deacylase AlaX
LEFGRNPLNAFRKAGRVVSVIVRITRAEKAIIKKTIKTIIKIIKAFIKLGKAITKRTISKRKAAEIETIDKNNNNSNEIKESEIVYIREADITPKVKRNIYLAKKT